MKKRVLLLRSHYPDVRTEKIRGSLSKCHEVRVIAWNRGDRKYSDNADLFHFPLVWQSPMVLAVLPLFQVWLLLKSVVRRPDAIHCADFDTVIPAIIASRILGCKVVYEIYDFYSDMIDLKSTLLKKAISLIDKRCIRLADRIIIVDENRVEQIGIMPDEATVIYNSPTNVLGEASFQDAPFIVFFGGFVSWDRGIVPLCEALADQTGVLLKICGEASPEFKSYLIDRFNGVSNIDLKIERVDHSTILRETLNSQAVPILYSPTIENNRYSSPNKLFEALSMGVPCIVYEGSSIDKKVNEHGFGIVVKLDDVSAIREAVMKMSKSEKTWNAMSQNALRTFNEIYSWEIMEKRLIDLYGDLFLVPCPDRQKVD